MVSVKKNLSCRKTLPKQYNKLRQNNKTLKLKILISETSVDIIIAPLTRVCLPACEEFKPLPLSDLCNGSLNEKKLKHTTRI